MSIYAKKTLGQHFLKSDKAIREIVEAGKVEKADTILEIGPGEGVLTEAMLKTGATVVAVEMDERCIPLLHARFSEEENKGQFILLEGDIRDKVLLSTLFSTGYLGGKEYKLIANIPYYITGLLFRMFLETETPIRQPNTMVYLIQKEVAEQLVSRDGKLGNLALAAMLYGTPKIISKVPKGAFVPPPKVDSTVVAIENISRNNIVGFTEKLFFALVHAGLASRRKMLVPNIVNNLGYNREVVESVMTEIGIDPKIRAEDLSFQNWIKLAQAFNKVERE